MSEPSVIFAVNLACSRQHPQLTEFHRAERVPNEVRCDELARKLVQQYRTEMRAGTMPAICPFCGDPEANFTVSVNQAKAGITWDELLAVARKDDKIRLQEAAEALKRRTTN
jgi:hypothetical protein